MAMKMLSEKEQLWVPSSNGGPLAENTLAINDVTPRIRSGEMRPEEIGSNHFCQDRGSHSCRALKPVYRESTPGIGRAAGCRMPPA
jgi:hypothetical protein